MASLIVKRFPIGLEDDMIADVVGMLEMLRG
jgi:hypothetical protein